VTVVLHTVLIRVEKLDESVGWIVLLLLLMRMLQRTDCDVMRNATAVMDSSSAHQGAHFHRTSSTAAPQVMMAMLLMMLQRVVVVMMMMRKVIRRTVNIVAMHLIFPRKKK
jgi:hypothetical protein